jgi:hypothetical protein
MDAAALPAPLTDFNATAPEPDIVRLGAGLLPTLDPALEWDREYEGACLNGGPLKFVEPGGRIEYAAPGVVGA